MKLWQGILLGIFLGFLFTGVILLFLIPSRGSPVELEPVPTSSPVLFYITGEVNDPGTYQLPAGSRIADAIQTAGGLLPDADTTLLNLAGTITDGERIWIPIQSTPTSDIISFSTATLAPPSVNNPLNINTATESELELLPGIGPIKASQIITYRQQNGLFTSIEDLKNVPGISASLYEAIKSLISVAPNS